MKIYAIKSKFQKTLSPIKNLLVKFKIHPTYINFAALFVSILAGYIFYKSSLNFLLLLWIPFLAFVRIALNALDGLVARELKVKNQQWGEVLNEFIDRLSDISFFLGIAFFGFTNALLVFITLITILLVSYLGILGKSAGGKRVYSGLMGKADRMFYLSVAAVLIVIFKNPIIINYLLLFILTLSIITIFQRIYTIKKELKK
jgi:CDP-diacylglycerol---glycerol-3-phosphate 3-phosphatidyltransferase